MRLFITSRGMLLTKELRSYIERRFHFASDRFANQLGDVTIVVRDVNGPRGGMDKECMIRVDSPKVGRLVVEERSEGVMTAIFGAVQRFSETVKRRIGRRRQEVVVQIRRAQNWTRTHEPEYPAIAPRS